MIENLSSLSPDDFNELHSELSKHKSLGDVLTWAGTKPKNDVIPQIVAEVITQDEFTHDVIVPYRNLFLAYDTT
jgi:hypothetical protein